MREILSNDSITVICIINLLDDNYNLECEFKPKHTGQELLDNVCKTLFISDSDYFGLSFVDCNKKFWLNLVKPIIGQMSSSKEPFYFYFRVKYYPPEPYIMADGNTQHYIFLQLRKDLLCGRLFCNGKKTVILLALLLQYNYGDFDDSIDFGSLEEFLVFPSMTKRIMTKTISMYKNELVGKTREQVKDLFLKVTSHMNTYGMNPQLIQGPDKKELYLGVNYRGISTFSGFKMVQHFPWFLMSKIMFSKNVFSIEMNSGEIISFNCCSNESCKHIWRNAVEQKMKY